MKQISLLDSKTLLTLPNNVELLISYVLLHLCPEYCSLNEVNGLHKQRKITWEFINEHVHYINFGTQDSFTYVIFAIDSKRSCISSL